MALVFLSKTLDASSLRLTLLCVSHTILIAIGLEFYSLFLFLILDENIKVHFFHLVVLNKNMSEKTFEDLIQ